MEQSLDYQINLFIGFNLTLKIKKQTYDLCIYTAKSVDIYHISNLGDYLEGYRFMEGCQA